MRALQQTINGLRHACVDLQAHAEQDEEYISNSLFKRIAALEKQKAELEVGGRRRCFLFSARPLANAHRRCRPRAQVLGHDTDNLHHEIEQLKQDKVCGLSAPPGRARAHRRAPLSVHPPD